MKALVTGASGFIGKALCEHLKRTGHDVVTVVRRESSSPFEPDAWRQSLEGCDSVLHLAGRAHVMRERTKDPLRAFREANVHPTLVLARQAAQAGVRRFVFVSSIKVNGDNTDSGVYFTAQDTPKPADAYATSKWEAELGLQHIARNSGMELVVVRPPLVYGPRVKGNFAQMIRLIRSAVPLPLGSIKNKRSLIALDNLVDFLSLCADAELSPQGAGQVFLVSDGVAVSTPQLLQKVAAALAQNLRLLPVHPSLLRLCGKALGLGETIDKLLRSLAIDDQAARSLLGWHPPVTMDEQLRRMSRSEAFL